MSRFSDMLARDSAVWVDPDQADAEAVTYTPRVGDARAIYVEVHREIAETEEAERGSLVSGINVLVRNSVTTGISSSELNTGGDTITVAERLGGTARALPIVEVLSQDAGMLYLRLGLSR